MRFIFMYRIYILAFLANLMAITSGQNERNTLQQTCERKKSLQNVECALDPQAMEGPYYLPLHLLRSNITEDRPGVPLKLNLIVMNSRNCMPIQNATVDIWHADAFGIYSGDVRNGAPAGSTFLRGIQVTNNEGEVTFHTIYPGWYPYRCIHIHIEVFVSGSLKHVGQMYFAPSITKAVKNAQPYVTRTDEPHPQEWDWLFNHNSGFKTTFKLKGNVKAGYEGIMYIGIDPEKTVVDKNAWKPGGQGD